MGTTPAFGLRYPEITDKVTDGALAIRNLAEDVDADLGAEVTRANAAYVAKALADAAGDLLVADGPDSFARLPRGAALQGLRVNAAGTALEYAPIPAGGLVSSTDTLTHYVGDLVSMAAGAYSTIFDIVSGGPTLLSAVIWGIQPGYRLTIDGVVVADVTSLARGRDAANTNHYGVAIVPPAKAATSMKLEMFHNATSSLTAQHGFRAVTR